MDNKPPFDPKDYKRVVIIAGETSADLHGSHLVMAMKRLNPEISFQGIGGEKMAHAEVKILFSSSELAVVGLTEVFSKLCTILRAAKKIKTVLKNDRPDLLILIDYPDFNLHIAKTANRFNIPVLYYISPQIWAWRRGRIRKIARRVDHMAVILPFEKNYYRQASIKVDYVGHPLLDQWAPEANREAAALKTGVGEGHPIVGLLPGSRKEEIQNLLPVMVGAVQILARRYPHIQCILPLAPGIDQSFVEHFIDNSNVKIKIMQGNIYDLLSVCDMALVTSGTATLETAIMEVPMVIVYKMSWVTYWIARMVIRVPYAGLVNLVAEEAVAPELIQDDATAERLAHEALNILENTTVKEDMINKLKRVQKKLGQGGASEKTAGIALRMIKG